MEASVDTTAKRSLTTDVSHDTTSTPAEVRDRTWTSEIFKIRVNGVQAHTQAGDIRKLAHSLGLKPVKIKKAPQWRYAFLTFNDDKERADAIRVFDGHVHKGVTLEANEADPREDPYQESQRKRRRLEGQASSIDNNKTVFERLSDKVTPLWREDYDRQLILKRRELSKKLRNTTRDLNKVPWAASSIKANEGLICPMEKVVKSPVLNEYRNKCEFTIGRGEDSEIVVGHLLGAYQEGLIQVVEPTECVHISKTAKLLASHFQQFIRQSPLPIHDRLTHTGYWRQLTVRTSIRNEAMAIVMVQNIGVEQEDADKELTRLTDYLKTVSQQAELKLTSCYLQNNTSMSGAATDSDPGVLLFGDPYLVETMDGLDFRIAPEAFFQVNTLAAEVLLGVVRSHCTEINANTTLLDVCCGTGTIGLSFAKNVRRVIGMDICTEAVENARENARLNGITNCDFRAKSAEDAIAEVMEEVDETSEKEPGNVIAIVDPPRGGLHKNVVRHLRRSPIINQLIYVSCNIGGAGANIVDLCRPASKKHKGTPFELVKAIPVDLFPHTLHCELVLILRRGKQEVGFSSKTD